MSLFHPYFRLHREIRYRIEARAERRNSVTLLSSLLFISAVEWSHFPWTAILTGKTGNARIIAGSESNARRVLIFEMETRHPSLAKRLALDASAPGPFSPRSMH